MKTPGKATTLRVQIKRLDVVSVDLKFPIFTLNMMETFIPEKAQAYLTQSSIDLPSIMKRIEDSDYAPQSVLSFDHEEKHFSIWIE